MFKNFNQRRFAAKALVLSAAAGSMTMAGAVGTDPISVLLASIDLTAVGVAVAAICLLIVGIKLTFKGPDVAGRVIKKV